MQPLRKEIEEMRGKQESMAFWQRRRPFLDVHWNKFPLEELNNLSYCYSSVMVYSCRYSPAMMNRLYDLAMEVADHLQREKENMGLPKEIKIKWDEALTEPVTLERITLNIGGKEGAGLFENEEDMEDSVDDEQLDVEEKTGKHSCDGELKGGITFSEMDTENSTSHDEQLNKEEKTEKRSCDGEPKGGIAYIEMDTESSTSHVDYEVTIQVENTLNDHCNEEQTSYKVLKPAQNLLRIQTENLSKTLNFYPQPTTSAGVESQLKSNTLQIKRQINHSSDQAPKPKYSTPRELGNNSSTLKFSTASHQNPLVQQQKSHHTSDTLSTGSKSNALLETCAHKASTTAGKWKQAYNVTSHKDMQGTCAQKASTTAGKWKQVYNASSPKDMHQKKELLPCQSPNHPLSKNYEKMSEKQFERSERERNACQDQPTGSNKGYSSQQKGMVPTKVTGKSECVEKTPTVQSSVLKGAKPGNFDTKAKMVTFQEQTTNNEKKDKIIGKKVNTTYPKCVWKVHSSSPFEGKDDLIRKRSADTKKDEVKKYTMKCGGSKRPGKVLSGKEATKGGRNDPRSTGPQKVPSSVDHPVVQNSRMLSNPHDNYSRGSLKRAETISRENYSREPQKRAETISRENYSREPQKRAETISRVIYSSNFTRPPPLPARNKVDVNHKGQMSKQAAGSYPKSCLPQSQQPLNKPKTTDISDKPKQAENAAKFTNGSTGYKPRNSIFKNFIQGLLQKARSATD